MTPFRAPLPLLAAALAAACQSPKPPADPLTSQLDQVMKDAVARRDMPGAALVVVRNDSVIFARGYGHADSAGQVPFTDTTHFVIGSTSKPLTAMAVLRLVAANKVALDTPIVRYVPDLHFKDPRGRAITLRHLLTNRSGMAVGFSGPAYRDPPVQDDSALSRLAHDGATMPLLFTPGEGYAYSNRGWALAGYVVQRVAGEAIENFMAREVFAPAGMRRTTLRFWELPDVVQGFVEGRSRANIPHRPSVTRAYGPAGMVASTPLDVGHLLITLLDGGTNPDGGQLLPKAEVDEMFRPQADAESELGGPTKYGLGWEIFDRNGTKVVQKAGSVNSMADLWMLMPDQHLGLAVFMTREDYGFAPVIGNIVAALSGGPASPLPERTVPTPPSFEAAAVGPAVLDRLLGVYDTRFGDVRVYRRADSLFSDYGGAELALIARNDSTYAMTDDVVAHTGHDLVFRRMGGALTLWSGKDSLGIRVSRP
jgi:CubicO group peptidase (beta-lactamase class C family)